MIKRKKMEAEVECENLENIEDISENSETTETVRDKNMALPIQFYLKDGNKSSNHIFDKDKEFNIYPTLDGSCQIVENLKMVENFSSPTGNLKMINFNLPTEIWHKILLDCDVKDVLSFSMTSKNAKSITDNYFWKHKFYRLLEEKKFEIDDYKQIQTLQLNYKAICCRFYKIFYENPEIDLHPCRRCKRFTCLQGCVEDGHQKVAVDIGSKLTWLISPNSELKRHQSILSLPKVVKCIDCDSVIKHRLLSVKGACNCTESEDREGSQLRSNRLQYCSQDINVPSLETCCLYCKNRTYMQNNAIENQLMRDSCEEAVEINTGAVSDDLSELCNGFCADAAQQMKLRSVDFVSPEVALRQGGKGLTIATAFLQHILTQCNVMEELRKPHGVLIFCEAIGLPREVRYSLLRFFFLRMKLSRVCLVPKPLAVCSEIGLKTSIVVDSGALHTSVSVVIAGKVVMDRCRELAVGGRHIAETLHCAHACDDTSQEIPVSSLDSSDVKDQCWLSYNREQQTQQQECTVKCESIWVPAPNRRNMRIKSWKQISLGNEVYRAPEYMYVLLDLPQVIQEVTKGLPEEQLKECLSHIAVTGGNTCLTGFEQRLRRDLVELMPQYEGIIELVRGLGSRSCDAAVGSTFIPFPMKQGVPPGPAEDGVPCWVSRDDYILFGTDIA